MVAVAHGPGLEVRDVTAPARFGDAERDDLVAAEYRRRDAQLQVFGAERQDRRQANAVRHQRRPEPARADRGEFLGQDQPVENVEAFRMAAILFGVAQPENARLGGFLVQFARQLALSLPAVDMRRDLAGDEAADALRQRLVGLVIIGRSCTPVVEGCHAPMLRGLDACVKQGLRRPLKHLRSGSMNKSILLAGLAAFALISTPAVAQKSPEAIAEAALKRAPVFDGHNDVPWELRGQVGNVINDFDFRDTTKPKPDGTVMHTDIQRLRKGHVGAQFWSVYVPSNTNEQQSVQQTIEQIDVAKRLIARYPNDLGFASTSTELEQQMKAGKVAGMLGIEGGQSIGSSLAVLREMYGHGPTARPMRPNMTGSPISGAKSCRK